jgi:hypothetical protein
MRFISSVLLNVPRKFLVIVFEGFLPSGAMLRQHAGPRIAS